MKIVVAAFEPFAGRRLNRSERAARHLEPRDGVEVVTLPVSFARIAAEVQGLFDRDPDVLLLCGESRAAKTLLIERVALNLADARVADNDGAQPRGVRLDPSGPIAREVDFDVHALADAVNDAGVPAAVSAHAGTFLCNAALYYALGRAARAVVAFVHVPARKRFFGARQAARGLEVVLDRLHSHATGSRSR